MKSKNNTAMVATSALAIAAFSLGFTTSAFAGETATVTAKETPKIEAPAAKAIGVTFDAGYDSAYIFRGVNILDAATEGGNLAWGQFAVTGYGFTAGAWYAQSVNEGNAGLSYNELDLFLSYTKSVGPVDLTAGYIYYLFPKDNALFAERNIDTHEFNVGISTTAIPFVTPSLFFYYDVELAEGGYLEFKLASSLPVVPEKVSIDPYALISYDFEYNSAGSDLNHFQAGISVPFHVTENFTISGYVAVTVSLDAISSFTDDYEVFAGGKASFAF